MLAVANSGGKFPPGPHVITSAFIPQANQTRATSARTKRHVLRCRPRVFPRTKISTPPTRWPRCGSPTRSDSGGPSTRCACSCAHGRYCKHAGTPGPRRIEPAVARRHLALPLVASVELDHPPPPCSTVQQTTDAAGGRSVTALPESGQREPRSVRQRRYPHEHGCGSRTRRGRAPAVRHKRASRACSLRASARIEAVVRAGVDAGPKVATNGADRRIARCSYRPGAGARSPARALLLCSLRRRADDAYGDISRPPRGDLDAARATALRPEGPCCPRLRRRRDCPIPPARAQAASLLLSCLQRFGDQLAPAHRTRLQRTRRPVHPFRALQGSRTSCPRCSPRNQSRARPGPITGSASDRPRCRITSEAVAPNVGMVAADRVVRASAELGIVWLPTASELRPSGVWRSPVCASALRRGRAGVRKTRR